MTSWNLQWLPANKQDINFILSKLAKTLTIGNLGIGVREVRLHENGEHRIIYIAKYPEGNYILHAFRKKTKKTRQKDIEMAKTRFRQVEALRKNP